MFAHQPAQVNRQTNTGGEVLNWAINGTLPSGLSFGANNGTVYGTPTELWPQTAYMVWANNSGGSTVTYLNITVIDQLPTVTYTPADLTLTNNTLSVDLPLEPIITGPGEFTSWALVGSFSPALPSRRATAPSVRRPSCGQRRPTGVGQQQRRLTAGTSTSPWWTNCCPLLMPPPPFRWPTTRSVQTAAGAFCFRSGRNHLGNSTRACQPAHVRDQQRHDLGTPTQLWPTTDTVWANSGGQRGLHQRHRRRSVTNRHLHAQTITLTNNTASGDLPKQPFQVRVKSHRGSSTPAYQPASRSRPATIWER